MQHDPNARLGRGMIWLSAIAILAGITWFFSGQIEQRYNPNQNVTGVVRDNLVEISLQRNRAGHYVASGAINGQPVDFLIDTGATDVVLPGSLARQLQLDNLGSISMQTANGNSQGYLTRLSELRLGPIVLRDVRASVAPNLEFEVLLGMSVLRQMDWQQRGDQLILQHSNND